MQNFENFTQRTRSERSMGGWRRQKLSGILLLLPVKRFHAMADREYIIFCDESDVTGKYYSNFYGGVLVGSSQYDRITKRLNAEKQKLNLFGEVKWSKVTAAYLAKYESFIRVFFKEVREKHVRVRIMFRHNVHA